MAVFTADNQPQFPGRKKEPVSQARQIQQVLYNFIVKVDVNVKDLAPLARAWCDANEEIRKLAMRPLPRSIDTTKLPKRGRAKHAASDEPVESAPKPIPPDPGPSKE